MRLTNIAMSKMNRRIVSYALDCLGPERFATVINIQLTLPHVYDTLLMSLYRCIVGADCFSAGKPISGQPPIPTVL